MANKKIVLFFLAPLALSFLLHWHVLRLDLIGYHVWRQTQTQTVVYNFSFSDNSILHPQRFDLATGSTALLYEFPLYQWLAAQLNNAFGYSVMHTRLLSFACFAFFLLGFYKLLRHFFSQQIALIVNALICFSPLLYYYCVNPLPDIMALAFATWCLHAFFSFLSSKSNGAFVLFCFFTMLAALVKLPYILFGGVYALYKLQLWRQNNYKALLKYGFIFILFLLPVAAWYVPAIPTWRGNGITSGMAGNSTPFVKLLDYFWFSLISSVPELLTNYANCIFLVTGMYLFFKHRHSVDKRQHCFILLFFLLAAYFLFELNMIEKTHDYYLMPFIPLIFVVVAFGARFFYESKFKWLVFFVMCIVPLTAWLRIDQRWNLNDPGFTKEYMTRQSQLNALLPKNAVCVIDFDNSKFIALYYLKRQGYSLAENEVNADLLQQLYKKGAHYFITQNANFDESLLRHFNTTLLFNNNLKVYQLSLK